MGELTDLFFTILGKAGRWVNIKGRRVCFVMWGLCVLYWAARNLSLGLYVQTFGCFFSFCLHVYGYFNWKKEGIGE
jgi:hypothetical protein